MINYFRRSHSKEENQKATPQEFCLASSKLRKQLDSFMEWV